MLDAGDDGIATGREVVPLAIAGLLVLNGPGLHKSIVYFEVCSSKPDLYTIEFIL